MDELIYASNKAMELILKLSLFPVAVATVVGLVVGLFQTVTQIQEQTLPFGIKLIAVILCIYSRSARSGLVATGSRPEWSCRNLPRHRSLRR